MACRPGQSRDVSDENRIKHCENWGWLYKKWIKEREVSVKGFLKSIHLTKICIRSIKKNDYTIICFLFSKKHFEWTASHSIPPTYRKMHLTSSFCLNLFGQRKPKKKPPRPQTFILTYYILKYFSMVQPQGPSKILKIIIFREFKCYKDLKL